MLKEAMIHPTQEPVLRVYRKVNPSATKIEDPDTWEKYATRLRQRFHDEYRLPIRLFRGATVLDAGCGTGEKNLVLASWGAKVTGVDYNEKALKRARRLDSSSRFASNLVFHNATLPNLPEAVGDRKFDFVHADG